MLPQRLFLNMYVFPHQSDIRPSLGLGAVGMGEQPLVASPQLRVIAAVVLHVRLRGVRALRQSNQYAEASGGIQVAGRIVQRRGVDFHQRARRDAERLDFGGVQLARCV